MKHLVDNLNFLEERLEVPAGSAVAWNIMELSSACEKAGIPLRNVLQYRLRALSLPWDRIKFVFLDVDGVMTEGGMFYTESGDEFKRFDTKDGMAIKHAMKAGIEFGIISSGINPHIIRHRADMFGIKHVYVGTAPKLEIAERWLYEMGLRWEECAYIGDDINDLALFSKVAIKVCPADAVDRVCEAADFVLNSHGGHGCIREMMRYFPTLKDIL